MPRSPSDGRVTAPYGPRDYRPTPTSPLFHYGEDTVGYGNRFPVDGVIISAAYVGSYGNRLIIRQASDPTIHWWLCHNASFPKGYGVWGKEGDFAAPMGATGNVTGVHVHTERRVNASAPGSGTHTNPRSVYTSTPAGGGTTTPVPSPTPEEPMATTILVKCTVGSEAEMAVRGWIMLAPGYELPVSDGHVDIAKGVVDLVITQCNAAQYDIIRALYTQGKDTNDVAVALDPASIASLVIASLNSQGIKVDTTAFAEDLRAKLQPEFDKVNKNIDEQGYTVIPKA